MKKTLFVLAIGLFPGAGRAAALDPSAGSTAMAFLRQACSARQESLGGAGVAARSGIGLLCVNPAALAGAVGNWASLDGARLPGDLESHAAAARLGWLGFRVRQLRDAGGIPRTTLSNPRGDGLGKAGFSALEAAAHAGATLAPGIRAGAAVKHLRETLDTTTARAWAADAGATVLLGERCSLGVAIRNAGAKARYQTVREALPLSAQGGLEIALLDGRLRALLDVEATKAAGWSPRAGVELSPVPAWTLRAGFDGQNDAGAGWSIGTGLDAGPLALNAAFTGHGTLGSAMRLGVSFSWGSGDQRRGAAAARERDAGDTIWGLLGLGSGRRRPAQGAFGLQ